MTTIAMHMTVYLKEPAGQSAVWEFAEVDHVQHNDKRELFIVEKNSQIIAVIPRENILMIVYDYDNVPDIGDAPSTLPIHDDDEIHKAIAQKRKELGLDEI